MNNCDDAAARLRLFCLPYAGGNVSIFRQWQAFLPAAVQLSPVELPGRGRHLHLPPIRRATLLLDWILERINLRCDVPVAFYGHSMGALLSFELARRAQGAGVNVVHVLISGCRAPDIKVDDEPTFDLPDREFIAELRRLAGTPDELLEDKDFLEFALPSIRADFELCHTYSYIEGPGLTCPITAFAGRSDKETRGFHLANWKLHTTSTFSTYLFTGGHFFINSQRGPFLRALARELTLSLNRLQR